MKSIPTEIKILYDTALVKEGVSPSAHSHCRKRLRFYLDFCLIDRHKPAYKECFAPSVQKLEAKIQTEQQRKQAFDAFQFFIK
jgi:hypothetical protein